MSIRLVISLAAALVLAQQPKKVSPADIDKTLTKLFDAPEADRAGLLEKLDGAEPLTAASVKTWAKKFSALMLRGPKLPDEKRGYFYDAKTKRGLYLFGGKSPGNGGLFFGLHGGGEGQGDASSAAGPWNGVISGEGWTAIFPEVIEKTEAAWGDEVTEKFVLELIESVKRTQKIDTNRIYLGGHSMGGYGTWTIGGRNADLFAGLMAFAGAATPYRVKGNEKVIEGIQDGILPNLRNLPIYVYHSKDDPRVDFPVNDFAVKELTRLQAAHGGYVHHFEAVDGKGHDFPDPKPAIEFIHKRVRDPRPNKFLWEPLRKWKRMFYWVWWNEPDPNSLVVAEITGPNQIALKVDVKKVPFDDVKGMSVLLDDRMGNMDKEWTLTVNGKERFKGVVKRSLAVMARTAVERRDPEMVFAAEIRL